MVDVKYVQTSSTDLGFADRAAGDYSGLLDALHCHFNEKNYALSYLQMPMAAGTKAWKTAGGCGDGMRGKGRWCRLRSTLRPKHRMCPMHSGAHQFGATPMSSVLTQAATCANMKCSDLLLFVRAVNRLHLACPNLPRLQQYLAIAMNGHTSRLQAAAHVTAGARAAAL